MTIEKQTKSKNALLVVRITNERRLNAAVTEDYFLVNVKDYFLAAAAIDEGDWGLDIEPVAEICDMLNSRKIQFEHITEGRKFFVGDSEDEDYEDE